MQVLGKSPKLVGKIQSQIDKIDDITIKADGSVEHNILRVTKRSSKEVKNLKKQGKLSKSTALSKNGSQLGAFRTWPSIQSFKSWRSKHLK